jgi:predicted CopG family antitoxin
MKERRSWKDVIQTLREHKCQTRILYLAKLSITIDGETKVFHTHTHKKKKKKQIHILSFHESSSSKDNNKKKITRMETTY